MKVKNRIFHIYLQCREKAFALSLISLFFFPEIRKWQILHGTVSFMLHALLTTFSETLEMKNLIGQSVIVQYRQH